MSAAMDRDDELLAAVKALDEKFDAKAKADDARFERIESEYRTLRADMHNDRETHAREAARQSEAITRIANASAHAADLALKAQRSAHEARDDNAKMIESALKIHNISIGSTVDAAVKAQLQPVAADLVTLKANDETQNATLKTQNATLKKQDETLDAIQKGINGLVLVAANPKNHRALYLLVLVGAAIGAALMRAFGH